MNRNRITRILAAGGASLIALCALPGTANAQFSPCALLGPAGAFMPPPCIKVDYKRLADTATQAAHEVEKIRETVNTINQTKAMTQGIVSDVRDLANTKLSLSFPNVDTNAGPILDGLKGNIAGYASKMGDTFFAGTDATVEETQQTQRLREGILADAVSDSYAYGLQRVAETEAAGQRLANLSSKACKSKDLRGDWTVNSEIKLELMNARARQAYLYSSYLRLASASGVVDANTRIPQGYNAGSSIDKALAQITDISQAAKVGKLTDILSKAQGLMGSLSVITMAASVMQQLEADTKTFDDYVAFMESKKAYLSSRVNRWADEGDKCRGSTIYNAVISGNSASVDRCIDKKHKTEFYSTAYGVAKENTAYPQEDTRHWNYQPGLDFYNVERAYRQQQLDEARAELADLQKRIAEENDKQGAAIDSESVIKDLTALVQEANGLGQEVGAGQDPGAKQQAAELLRRLQELVSQGTSLPPVDVTPVTPGTGGGTTDEPPVDQPDPNDPYDRR
jgi:hypothetical protein